MSVLGVCSPAAQHLCWKAAHPEADGILQAKQSAGTARMQLGTQHSHSAGLDRPNGRSPCSTYLTFSLQHNQQYPGLNNPINNFTLQVKELEALLLSAQRPHEAFARIVATQEGAKTTQLEDAWLGAHSALTAKMDASEVTILKVLGATSAEGLHNIGTLGRSARARPGVRRPGAASTSAALLLNTSKRHLDSRGTVETPGLLAATMGAEQQCISTRTASLPPQHVCSGIHKAVPMSRQPHVAWFEAWQTPCWSNLCLSRLAVT